MRMGGLVDKGGCGGECGCGVGGRVDDVGRMRGGQGCWQHMQLLI